MGDYWKAAAIVVLVVILGASLGKTEKDMALVLSAVACCLVAATALGYLSDVIAFLWKLEHTAAGGSLFLEPLLKITGVSLLGELVCLISADGGNASLGKAMQILGNCVILVLALPIFETFFTMVQELLRLA